MDWANLVQLPVPSLSPPGESSHAEAMLSLGPGTFTPVHEEACSVDVALLS